jgi:hypothetical protein
MSRKLLFGIAMVAGLSISGTQPEAAPLKPASQTKLSSTTVNGQTVLRAEGNGVKFFKRVDKSQVVISLEAARDHIDLEVKMDGQVRVVRNGQVLKVSLRDDMANAMTRVQKLTAGSKALAGFEALVAGVANDTRLEAQSLRVSHALVHAVRGNTAPAMAFATRQAPRSDRGIARALSRSEGEQPTACWAEYASFVNHYNVVFNDCIESYWWIPGWTAACGAQFALQSELAFFWLISCSGGLPV